MLNLFKTISNKKNKQDGINNKIINLKHFPSATREWNNIIYFFNKTALNLIPVATKNAMDLIKSYFYLYNSKLEQRMRKERLLVRLRRLSSNKIYISNGGFKHTNNKLIVTLYLLNRQKKNLLIKIKKQYYKIFFNFKKRLNNKFNLINLKGLKFIYTIDQEKYLVIKALSNINLKDKNLSLFLNKFYSKLINKSLIKLSMFIYYKQLIYLNKSKYNYLYLQYLKKHMENIFNKNVEFNLINLKYFYLNSDIMSESLTLKITRNRRKILKHLNRFKNKIKIQKKSFILDKNLRKTLLSMENIINNKNVNLKNYIIKNLKYKHITGYRLEAKGRLTRRFTASRSVSKLIYKGNLMNIDSSYRGLSSIILKGNLRSNVQLTKLQSKTRIGSFGIKGWVSSN